MAITALRTMKLAAQKITASFFFKWSDTSFFPPVFIRCKSGEKKLSADFMEDLTPCMGMQPMVSTLEMTGIVRRQRIRQGEADSNVKNET